MVILLVATGVIALTGCETLHRFAEPARDWQARNGQLLYRNARTTLIGEVLVRSSKTGEFELTFSKGGGLNLMTLKQDSEFARIEGPLAHPGWSGPIGSAPKRLRPWLDLRDVLAQNAGKPSVRHVAGGQTFIFQF
jgi:hypothetical protein